MPEEKGKSTKSEKDVFQEVKGSEKDPKSKKDEPKEDDGRRVVHEEVKATTANEKDPKSKQEEPKKDTKVKSPLSKSKSVKFVESGKSGKSSKSTLLAPKSQQLDPKLAKNKKHDRKRKRVGRWLVISAPLGSSRSGGGRLGENNVIKLSIYSLMAICIFIASLIIITGGSVSLYFGSEASAVNLCLFSGIILFFVSIMNCHQGGLQYALMNRMLSSLWMTPLIGFFVALASAVMSLQTMYCESMAKKQETYNVAYSPMCFSLRSIIFKSNTTRSITLFDDELCFWGSVVAMAFCLVQAYTGRMLEHIELERRKESNVQMEIGEADVEEYSKNASLGDESKEKAGVLPSPQVTIQPPPQ